MHEMTLAQAVFEQLEQLAKEHQLTTASIVHLKILDADTDCLVNSLKMLASQNQVFENAEIRTVESPGEIAPDGARCVIERIEGEND